MNFKIRMALNSDWWSWTWRRAGVQIRASFSRPPNPQSLLRQRMTSIRRVREAYDAYEHATAASRHRTLVTDRLVDLMAVAGTPDDVRMQVDRLAGVAGLTRVIAFPQAPGTGFAAREEILKMFAEAVASRWHTV